MASFPSKLIFPCSGQVGETELSDEFSTSITESSGQEDRFSLWEESRMVIDISGMRFTNEQRRLIRGFNRAIKGAAEVFWFRRPNDPEYRMENEYLGTGDGLRTQYQCRIYDEVQGTSGEYIVRALDHDIEPFGLDVNGHVAFPTSYIAVKVAGATKQLTADYTVDRETGVITFLPGHLPQAGQEVRVSGGFYVPVRMSEDGIRLTPLGSDWYEASEGIRFIQPKGNR